MRLRATRLLAIALGDAGAAGGPWTPLNLATLELWLDALDPATITDSGGGSVSAWADKSGNGNDLTQGSGTKRPNYSANGVSFDGNNDEIEAATSILTNDFAGEFTYFTVCAFDNVTTEAGYMLGTIANTADKGVGLRQNGAAIDVHNGTVASGASLTITQAIGELAMLGFLYNNQNVEFSNDGTISSGSGTFDYPAQGTPFRLGNRLGGTVGTTYWDGTFHEVIVCSTALNTADRQFVEGYLAWKWGGV